MRLIAAVAAFLIGLSVSGCAKTPPAKSPTRTLAPTVPRMVVQLVAQFVSEDRGVEVAAVDLILSDGSHAVGNCFKFMAMPDCIVEPFVPEKRVFFSCTNTQRTVEASCIKDEFYYADRRGNDLLVYGQRGTVTYHITGSWDSWVPGKLDKPAFNPNWTAYCNDGTYSYSRDRSGTCSDHGGVYTWHP